MRYDPEFGFTWRGQARFDPLTMAAVMTVAGGAASASGTIAGGNAAYDAGVRGKDAKEFEAVQLENQAQESRAAAQRSALDKRREGDLLTSKLIARGGSGASSDVGIVDLAGDIAQRGEFEALTEMFKGENFARGREDAALGARLTGDALLAEGVGKRKAAKKQALGTIIGSAGSAMSLYGSPGTPRRAAA